MMGVLRLQVDSVCLDNTLAFKNLFCSVHMAPKLHFVPIFGHLIYHRNVKYVSGVLTILQVKDTMLYPIEI